VTVVTSTLRDRLRERFGERVRFDEPLSRHTSFRIGGPADVWVEVDDADEILAVQRLARDGGLPIFVIGIGTNVLVSDRGVRGVVVKLGRGLGGIDWEPAPQGMRVAAGAATPFKKVVLEAAARDLTGLEFAEGIPGSIGGGLLMNAGAFGGEMADVVESVEGAQAERGLTKFDRAELRFGYRSFELPPGLVITRVCFRLCDGHRDQIRARMADAKGRRESKQPLGLPNAGSIFKNPPGEFAGRLIDAVGLKGSRIGGAMVSEAHANFIVNVDGARAADVKRLMDQIVDEVWRQKQVRLVPEIRLVGDWEAGM
jgi:UDP-N-acetylmuramate dehydrogenase